MKKLLCLILISSFLLSLYACKGEVTDTEVTEEESYVPVDISDVVSPFSINGEKVPYADETGSAGNESAFQILLRTCQIPLRPG